MGSERDRRVYRLQRKVSALQEAMRQMQDHHDGQRENWMRAQEANRDLEVRYQKQMNGLVVALSKKVERARELLDAAGILDSLPGEEPIPERPANRPWCVLCEGDHWEADCESAPPAREGKRDE